MNIIHGSLFRYLDTEEQERSIKELQHVASQYSSLIEVLALNCSNNKRKHEAAPSTDNDCSSDSSSSNEQQQHKKIRCRLISQAPRISVDEIQSIEQRILTLQLDDQKRNVRLALYQDQWYVHGCDFLQTIERKSNISRLIGKYSSPEEKIMFPVRSKRNNHIGQYANMLSIRGVHRVLLSCTKLRFCPALKQWIEDILLPEMITPGSTTISLI